MSCGRGQLRDLATRDRAALERQLAYLVMRQPHPRRQVVGDSQDVPQDPDLKLVKRLVDRRFQQRLKLMHAILELGCRFRVFDVAVAISVGY